MFISLDIPNKKNQKQKTKTLKNNTKTPTNKQNNPYNMLSKYENLMLYQNVPIICFDVHIFFFTSFTQNERQFIG